MFASATAYRRCLHRALRRDNLSLWTVVVCFPPSRNFGCLEVLSSWPPRVPTGLGSCLDLINPVSGLKCWRSALRLGPLIKLPFAVTSLWGQCVVRWVKAHQNPSVLVGHQLILALFNSYADREAKTCLKAFARAALYRPLLHSLNATVSWR